MDTTNKPISVREGRKTSSPTVRDTKDLQTKMEQDQMAAKTRKDGADLVDKRAADCKTESSCLKNTKKARSKRVEGKVRNKGKEKSTHSATPSDSSDNTASENEDEDELSESGSNSSTDSELEFLKDKKHTKRRALRSKDFKQSVAGRGRNQQRRHAKSESSSLSDSEHDASARRRRRKSKYEHQDIHPNLQLQSLQSQLSQMQLQLAQPGSQPLLQSGLGHAIPANAVYPGGNFGFPHNSFTSDRHGLPSSTPRGPVPPPARLMGRGRSPKRPGLFGRGLNILDSRSLSRSLSRSRSRSRSLRRSRSTSRNSDRHRPAFKRVDWVWDSKMLSYKLRDTAKAVIDAQYGKYIFQVKRHFDPQGRYRHTNVEIKSKILREKLKEIIGEVRGLNLLEEVPRLNPDMLFLYMDDLKQHFKKLKKGKPTGSSKDQRKKDKNRRKLEMKQLKLLLQYLHEDYAEIKQRLDPMLRNGVITFELLWALWKPNTLAFTTTYESEGEPRVFKVEMAERHVVLGKGEYYFIDGNYFEFNGKKFGLGALNEEIPAFRGTRKITTLPCYPLKYHKNEASVRKQLIERGKKFVALCGVHYKSYSGMAYLKSRKEGIVKFNVPHSRIMVDNATFRRINPNYSTPPIVPKESKLLVNVNFSGDEIDSFPGSCDELSLAEDGSGPVKIIAEVYEADVNSASSEAANLPNQDGIDTSAVTGNASTVNEGNCVESNNNITVQPPRELTDEEYLLASPVLLGFAFAEKQWLEFKVSLIHEIEWNGEAWDSLVLEPATKDLIQALVKARKYHGSKTIDDVIRGKGKGLVTVLHGPPGTGKTLTAEGISELLKCPLYAVSAGELGTDSRFLEAELQRILDICHTWGAILLLDEADVFLERRSIQDVHRNSLVSIFLRQLEYFQGILFLTTNRVETFDDAFQSRIHIALRYDALDLKAKRAIFKMFIDRVIALGKLGVEPFLDEDFNKLAKHELNGREIKNVVGSAQDLAVNKNENLSMKHIRQVLEVHVKFRRDLNGGTGYEDAMRSYF